MISGLGNKTQNDNSNSSDRQNVILTLLLLYVFDNKIKFNFPQQD